MRFPTPGIHRRVVRALPALFLLCALTACLHRHHRTDRALLGAARLHHIDARLLRAVALRESRMNPSARGAAGEIGLFQILPNTAKHWAEVHQRPPPSEARLFRVTLNAEIAAWYLRRGLDRFPHRADPLPFALAYYNAGPSRAIDWDQRLPDGIDFQDFIPFPSTRAYVRDILDTYQNDS